MIKAICFDLDGVYFTSAGMQEFAKALSTLCKDEEKARQALFASDEMKQFKQGKLTEKEYWNYVNTYLGLNLSLEEYKNLLGKKYEVNKKVETFAKSLKGTGYRICICSNNFVTRINVLQNKFKFLDNFDVVVLSYQVGATKPDKAIFQALIDKSGVKPEEIFYSDDTEEKMAGAKELGIITDVYTTFETFINKLKELEVNA